MLDALVNRQDRDVARTAETTVRKEALKRPQYLGRAVAVHKHALNEIWARQRQGIGRDGRTCVLEQIGRAITQ